VPLTSSPSVVRIGSQTPRLESFPLFHTSAGDDAVDLAAVAGLVMDPWQEHVLRSSLGEQRNGKWTSTSVGLVVPRQNGKNALLEARELAGLFLFGEKLIIHTAHEVATARESMLALMSRLKASPELMEHVKGFEGDPDKDFAGMKTGNDPGITLKNGNRLAYRARSKGSGRGFSGDLVIADEAYALKKDEIAALFPTMAAKSMAGNYQVWFTSSAGMPDSDFLADLRDKGIKKSSARLAYFEWSTGDDVESDDREGWYEANPGLGIRISEQFVEDEMLVLGADEFRRERLGIWEKLGPKEVFPRGLWQNRIAGPHETKGHPVIALDVRTGLQQSVAVSVAVATDCGFDLLDVARYESGVDQTWGEEYIVGQVQDIMAAHEVDSVVVDGYAENESLIVRLEQAGISVVRLSTRDMANAAVGLQDALINDAVRHSDDRHLNAAVRSAAKRTYGDALWLWSAAKSSGDITTLRAVTAAWWVLQLSRSVSRDPLDSVF
jgi:phage terminase large subunit-like protein